jgi:hypothetical protein
MRIVRVAPAPGSVPYSAIFGVIALLGAAAAWLRMRLPLEWLRSLCPLHSLTGIPCPACGSTRALAALAAAHPLVALANNPLVALLAPGAVVLGLVTAACRLAGWRLVSFRLERREETAARVAAALLVGANWLYLIAFR